MSSAPNRTIGYMFGIWTKLFRGRTPRVNYQRFPENLAARSQPPPTIPGGPNHKITQICYYKRDTRREVEPEEVIYTANQLKSGKVPVLNKAITPGEKYRPIHIDAC